MAYNKPVLSGYNSNPPADDGSEVASNEIRWVTHVNKLGNPLKQYADAINNAVEALFDGDQIDTGNLGTGTADATVFLRGDGSWSATLTGGITLGGSVDFTSGFSLQRNGNSRIVLGSSNTDVRAAAGGAVRLMEDTTVHAQVLTGGDFQFNNRAIVDPGGNNIGYRIRRGTDSRIWDVYITSARALVFSPAASSGGSSDGDIVLHDEQTYFGPLLSGGNGRNDLGTATRQWRDIHLSRDAFVGNDLDVTGDATVGGTLDVTGAITGDFTEGGLGTYAMVGSKTVGGPAFDWGDTTSGSNLRPVNTNSSTTGSATELSGTWRIMSAGLVTTTGPSIDSGGLAVRIA